MSWPAQAWAAEQRPGSSACKLVLLALASVADTNHRAYPSVQWLCDFSELNRKTVILALDRLASEEMGLIEDTGYRMGKTRQVKVYRLRVDEALKGRPLGKDPGSETVPKTERSQKRNSSVFSSKESQKRDTEPFKEPYYSPLPPKDGGKKTRLKISDDWQAPDLASLPPHAQASAALWPAGAYEAQAETFAQWHRGKGSRSADWPALWASWVASNHASVMRNAKAGITPKPVTQRQPTGPKPEPRAATAAKAQEDNRSAGLHDALRDQLGEAVWARWFGPSALVMRNDGLTVVCPTRFMRDHVEAEMRPALERALAANGWHADWIKFDTQPAPGDGAQSSKRAA